MILRKFNRKLNFKEIKINKKIKALFNINKIYYFKILQYENKLIFRLLLLTKIFQEMTIISYAMKIYGIRFIITDMKIKYKILSIIKSYKHR